MKRKAIISLLIFLLSFGIFTYVKADSGWDTSYDKGSSSSHSSSDSSSHSSYDSPDYDSSSSYSSSGGHKREFNLKLFLLIFLPTMLPSIFIVIFGIIMAKVSMRRQNTDNIVEMNENRILKIYPEFNIEKFKKIAFDIYKDIQIAWMNFDYDKLKQLVTDEMYNMYKSQLETLKLKQQQNIMEDFELEYVKIIGIEKISNTVSIKTLVKVSFYDYVINTKTNEVVRGNKNEKLLVEYEIIYTQSLSKVDKCPNCGEKLDDKNEVCLYCRSKINKLSNKFVMSKKRNIFQTYK